MKKLTASHLRQLLTDFHLEKISFTKVVELINQELFPEEVIDLTEHGFLKVSDYCQKHNISRQYVQQTPELFEVIKVSKNKVYVRKR